MREKPGVTIITSAYNAEKTLSRTIRSVLNQSFGNFEYILINHGSRDNTKAVIEEYAKEDQRIKVLNMDNNLGCPAGALNLGMKRAKGEYICFLDADDKYKNDFLQVMLTAAKIDDLDVVTCSCDEIYVGESWREKYEGHHKDQKFKQSRKFLAKEKYEDGMGEFLGQFEQGFLLYDVYWNKLYRRKFLNDFKLEMSEKHLYFADALFNDKVFMNFPRSSFLTYAGVNWTVSGSSTSYTKNLSRESEIVDYVKSHYKWCEILKGNLKVGDKDRFEERLIELFIFLMQFDLSNDYSMNDLNLLQIHFSDNILNRLLNGKTYLSFAYKNSCLNHFLYLLVEVLVGEKIDKDGFLKMAFLVMSGKIEKININEIMNIITSRENYLSVGNIPLMDMWMNKNLDYDCSQNG